MKGMDLFKSSLTCPLNNLSQFSPRCPSHTESCIDAVLRIIPRESYNYSAAGNVDGKLTVVLVFNAGDDKEYLRKTYENS